MSDAFRVLVVAEPEAVRRYPTGMYRRSAARTTHESIGLIERERPAMVILDWDTPSVDHDAVCRATQMFPTMMVMASLGRPEQAPSAIRSGCHAILLAPFPPNLAANRIARLSRQMMPSRGTPEPGARGTHHRWDQVRCPACAAPGATSFEFATRGKLWFACLTCDHVWLAAAPC